MSGEDNALAGVSGFAQTSQNILDLILRDRLYRRRRKEEKEEERIPISRVEALSGRKLTGEDGLEENDYIYPQEIPLMKFDGQETAQTPVLTPEMARQAAREGKSFAKSPVIIPDEKPAPRGKEIITSEQAKELRAKGVKITSDKYEIQSSTPEDRNDAKTKADQPRAKKSVQEAIREAQKMKHHAQNILDSGFVGASTGLTGVVTRWTPGTPTFDVDADINTLKTEIGFGALQKMRETSKTGGAIGSVSDREQYMLQNSLENLDPKQSSKKFKKNLRKVIEHADNTIAGYQRAYSETYGEDLPVDDGNSGSGSGLEKMSDEELLKLYNEVP